MSAWDVQYSPTIHRAQEHTREERISLKLSRSRARTVGRSLGFVSMTSRTKKTTSSALAVFVSPRKSAPVRTRSNSYCEIGDWDVLGTNACMMLPCIKLPCSNPNN